VSTGATVEVTTALESTAKVSTTTAVESVLGASASVPDPQDVKPTKVIDNIKITFFILLFYFELQIYIFNFEKTSFLTKIFLGRGIYFIS
jgi:hypothetical protein